MLHSRLNRGALLLVSILGMLCLYSASASAAGVPTQVEASWRKSGIAHFEFVGKANPNGAATTLNLEYRKKGTAEAFTTVLSKSIGSGTTQQTVSTVVGGLKPMVWYETRVTATNSFGSKTATDFWETRWRVAGVPAGTAVPYSTSGGNFRLEYTASGSVKTKVECNEASTGTLNSTEGASDQFKLGLSSCVTYENGVEVCKPTAPWGITLNGTFTSELSYINWNVCPNSETVMPLSFTSPFIVTMAELQKVEQPVTMTANASYGFWPATITINSTWRLAGEYSGKKFAQEFE